MAQVWLSNVPTPPLPLSQLLILIPLSPARLRPFPHTRSRKSGPCVYGQTGHNLAVIPIRIPSSPSFTVSSVVPVECWKSDPSLQFWLLHCHFFLLYYSIEVSLFRFSILLLFSIYRWLLEMQLGHSSPFWVQGICPPIPPDVPLVIWHVGDGFLDKKLVNMIFLYLILIYIFCAGFNHYFYCHVSLIISDILC